MPAFARSLPLAKAIHEDTLVAYEMNGEAIPPEHGGPVRAVVPGWYATDSVKWLERIPCLGGRVRSAVPGTRLPARRSRGGRARPVARPPPGPPARHRAGRRRGAAGGAGHDPPRRPERGPSRPGRGRAGRPGAGGAREDPEP